MRWADAHKASIKLTFLHYLELLIFLFIRSPRSSHSNKLFLLHLTSYSTRKQTNSFTWRPTKKGWTIFHWNDYDREKKLSSQVVWLVMQLFSWQGQGDPVEIDCVDFTEESIDESFQNKSVFLPEESLVPSHFTKLSFPLSRDFSIESFSQFLSICLQSLVSV